MIGYISVVENNEKYTGGVLVVDSLGIPVEFKYTEPITPTKLQKIIYGKSLKQFLLIEVIAKNLLSHLNNKPSVVFTDNMDLLEAGENIFFISKIFGTQERDTEEGEYIINSPSLSYRIVGNSPLSEESLNFLKETANHIDLTEPFERLKAALNYLCEES